MPLFEYAVVKSEKKDRDHNVVEAEKFLVEPDFILARDQNQVNLKIARMIPETDLEDADRIVIMVRPF